MVGSGPQLSYKTPEMLEREIRMAFSGPQPGCRLMFKSARKAGVPLARSFAGALSAARRQAEALLRARTQRQAAS